MRILAIPIHPFKSGNIDQAEFRYWNFLTPACYVSGSRMRGAMHKGKDTQAYRTRVQRHGRVSNMCFADEFVAFLKESELWKGHTRLIEEAVGNSRYFSRWANGEVLPGQDNWDKIVKYLRRKRNDDADFAGRLAGLTELLVKAREAKHASVVSQDERRKNSPKPSRSVAETVSARHEAVPSAEADQFIVRFLADSRIAAQVRTTSGKRAIYLEDVYVHRKRAEQAVIAAARRYWQSPAGYWLSIEGDAGHGKTSLVWFLTRELRQSKSRVYPIQALQIAAGTLDSLLALLPSDGNGFAVLLDTLDLLVGVNDAALGACLNEIRARGGLLVTTCRRQEIGLVEPYARSNQTVFLGRYDPDEARGAVERYVAQAYGDWTRAKRDAQTEYVWNILDSRRRIQDLNFEPLLLRMIFEAYVPRDIPPDINTQQVYDHFWNKRVLGDRGGTAPEQAHARSVLARSIASHLYFDRDLHTEEISVDSLIAVGHSQGITNPVAVMKGLISSGVLHPWETRESVRFFHQTFLEYTAARAVLELGDPVCQRQRIELLFADVARANLFRIPVLKQLLIQASVSAPRLFDSLCEELVAIDSPVAARLALEVLGKAQGTTVLHAMVLAWARRKTALFRDVAPEILRYYPASRLRLAFSILGENLADKAGTICSLCSGFAAMEPAETLAFLYEKWHNRPGDFRGHETDLKAALIAIFRAGEPAVLDLIADVLPCMSAGLQAGALDDLSASWSRASASRASAFFARLFPLFAAADGNEGRSAFVRAFASLHRISPEETRDLLKVFRQQLADAHDAKRRIFFVRLRGVAGADRTAIREAVKDVLHADHSRRMGAREFLREAALTQHTVLDEILALPDNQHYSDEARNTIHSIAAQGTDAARMLAILNRWAPAERGAGNAYRVLVKSALKVDPPAVLAWLKKQRARAGSSEARRQVLVGFQMLAENAATHLPLEEIQDLFRWGFGDPHATDEMRRVAAGVAGRFAEVDIAFAKSAFRSIFSRNRQDFINAAINSLQTVTSSEFIGFAFGLTIDASARKGQYESLGHFIAVLADSGEEIRETVVRELAKPKAMAVIRGIDNAVTASNLLKLLKGTAAANPHAVVEIANACPTVDDGNAATLAAVLENVAYHIDDVDLARTLLRQILHLASNPSGTVRNALFRAFPRFVTLLPHREAVEAVRSTFHTARDWDEKAIESLAKAARRMKGWTRADTEELLRCDLPPIAQVALLSER